MTDMDAAERAYSIDLFSYAPGNFKDVRAEIAEQIRQAETIAHEKGRQAGLEEAAVLLDGKPAIYPTSVFLEPPAGEHGKTVDGCSAAALRKTAPRWAGEVRALKDKPEGGQ